MEHTRPLLLLALAVGLGSCAGAGGNGNGNGSEPLACGNPCPANTNQVDIDFQGAILDDTLIIETEGCFASCEPVTPCYFPSVPVVVELSLIHI